MYEIVSIIILVCFIQHTVQVDGDHSRRRPLSTIFENHEGFVFRRWDTYADIFDDHFTKWYSRENVRMLEIGVQSGGSIAIWKEDS